MIFTQSITTKANNMRKFISILFSFVLCSCSPESNVERTYFEAPKDEVIIVTPGICKEPSILEICNSCLTFGCSIVEHKDCPEGYWMYSEIIKCIHSEKIQQSCQSCYDVDTDFPVSDECLQCANQIADCPINCQ